MSREPLPKPQKRKKKRTPTPIPTGAHICACGCGHTKYLSIHHVYFGRGQRNLSSRYNCVTWLCYAAHQSSTGIHGTHSDNKLNLRLKREHQRKLMDNGMLMKEFIRIFGKNYL